MKYCGHVWPGAPSYYLESLDKLQKQICMTIGPYLPSLLNPCLIIGLGLFYRYYFGRSSSELTELVPLPYS